MNSEITKKCEKLIMGLEVGEVVELRLKIRPESMEWFIEVAKLLSDYKGRELAFNEDFTRLKRIK